MTTPVRIRTKHSRSSKLRAFAVCDNDDGTGGVVFARHPIVALKLGASRFGNGDWRTYHAVRAPWADDYADAGDVPQCIAVAHGWYFECAGCGRTVNEDYLVTNGLTCDDVTGSMSGPAYCCTGCQQLEAARMDRVNAAKIASIDMLRALLTRRFPDAAETTTHAYGQDYDGCSVVQECVVYFDFPGQKISPASLRLRRGQREIDRIGPVRPEFWCAAGDKDAFEAWARANRPICEAV